MDYACAKNALPLITVGIPTFNRPENLRRALIEITQQSYKNLEIIVSDNASPGSETENVVLAIMQHDPRVKYFKQLENIGPVHNFQFVLMHAKGEYFMWASDDDWHDKTFIEVLYRNIATDAQAVVSFCDFDSRDESGKFVSGYPNFYDSLKQMRSSSNLIRQIRFFLLREGTAKPHPIYGLIRRKCLTDFSWIDFVNKYGWLGSDVLFVFYLLSLGRLSLSDEKLFGSTVGNEKKYESVTNTWNLRKYLNFIQQFLLYILGYLRIAKGWTKIILVILLPLKLLEIIYLFAVKPGINILKKMRP